MRLTVQIKTNTPSSIAFMFTGSTMEQLCSIALLQAIKRKKIQEGAIPEAWLVMSDSNADWNQGIDLDEESFSMFCLKPNTRIMVVF